MKVKTIKKKLMLSKETVSNLDHFDMTGIVGGSGNPDCGTRTVCATVCAVTCQETCANTCDCPHPSEDPTHCVTC